MCHLIMSSNAPSNRMELSELNTNLVFSPLNEVEQAVCGYSGLRGSVVLPHCVLDPCVFHTNDCGRAMAAKREGIKVIYHIINSRQHL